MVLTVWTLQNIFFLKLDFGIWILLSIGSKLAQRWSMLPFRLHFFQNYFCCQVQSSFFQNVSREHSDFFLSQSYFCHCVQMCFDKLDVYCFLINLALKSFDSPIFKNNTIKKVYLTSPASRQISIALIQRAWAQASTHIAPDEALNTLIWPVAKPPIIKSL